MQFYFHFHITFIVIVFLLISIEYPKAVLIHADHIESCFHLKYVLISFIDIFCKWHSSDQLIFVCNMWVEHAWCKCVLLHNCYIYMVEVLRASAFTFAMNNVKLVGTEYQGPSL